MKHHLKIKPEYFEAVIAGTKTVELRSEEDRHFDVGDILILYEFPMASENMVRSCRVVVTHVLRDVEWLPPGIAALSIALEPAPRATVQWFARHMEHILRLNDNKGDWSHEDTKYFSGRIMNEWRGLRNAMEDGRSVDEIIDTCADVANFAMMLADVARHKGI